MEVLTFTRLELPKLLEAASQLPSFGYLLSSTDKLVYLNIDDAFIHTLFPLLDNPKLSKPNYFGDNSIGAHISVIYPEENVLIAGYELNQKYDFKINGVFTGVINSKKYYVLGVDAPKLLNLRKRYDLPTKLLFKNHRVGLHVTLATQKQ